LSNEDAGFEDGKNIDYASGFVASATDVYNKASSAVQAIAQSDVKRRPRSYIALYVPDTVNVSYSSQYNDQVELTSALGLPYFLAQAGSSVADVIKKITKDGVPSESAIINAIGSDPFLRQAAGGILGKAGLVAEGGNVSQLLLRGVGKAINPQLQVLFQGTGFRSFQFDFTLTPYSKLEADTIKEIIKAFKYAAAPEINRNGVFGTQGMFFKVPDMFDIQFYYEGKINENVHKITRCVLTDISVDYAPIGWVTYDGGEPVQTKLSLQFKEIEIVDKTRIKDGY
jgi:hypothetical protein